MVKPLIFIQEPWGSGARALFTNRGFTLVDTPEACDVIVFNGGEDIGPEVYGEKPIAEAHLWLDRTGTRDKVELEGYTRAKNKFKFGICRGGQLLNCLNGGRLWQDVDKHNRAHDMIVTETGETLYTSSVHHQQFILGPEAVVIAKAALSTRKLGYINGKVGAWYRDDDDDPKFEDDPEIVLYPKDRALCIQGHPEYPGYNQLTDFCFNLMERYY